MPPPKRASYVFYENGNPIWRRTRPTADAGPYSPSTGRIVQYLDTQQRSFFKLLRQALLDESGAVVTSPYVYRAEDG